MRVLQKATNYKLGIPRGKFLLSVHLLVGIDPQLSLNSSPKFQKKVAFPSLLDRKSTLFSGHNMIFDMKFQPLTTLSQCCHKLVSDLNIFNILDFPI